MLYAYFCNPQNNIGCYVQPRYHSASLEPQTMCWTSTNVLLKEVYEGYSVLQQSSSLLLQDALPAILMKKYAAVPPITMTYFEL